MQKIPYYIVDVFTEKQYGGNQLAVFLDFDDHLDTALMQQMAHEIGFSESTFIKKNRGNRQYAVRIFMPDREVPFAGHPTIGTSYVVARFLEPTVPQQVVLELMHNNVPVDVLQPDHFPDSVLMMLQAQPVFGPQYDHSSLSAALGIPMADLDQSLPIQAVSTGLPFVIVPVVSLEAMSRIYFDARALDHWLSVAQQGSDYDAVGLFFFTPEANEPGNDYNTRMLYLEHRQLKEDAATGSANGCLLAYLLRHVSPVVQATVEQGFQIGRKSYLSLEGARDGDHYTIRVGGQTQLVAEGMWYC
jgi:trans-2,3-dihydro-3-hydroxyanthranilate isomerase